MDSDGIPSSYDQPAWVGKNSFLIEKEGIRILLELDNIPEDRLNSILLGLEQILNYAAHKTDYFTVRLNPDGQISGDFGNVVPPSAFNN